MVPQHVANLFIKSHLNILQSADPSAVGSALEQDGVEHARRMLDLLSYFLACLLLSVPRVHRYELWLPQEVFLLIRILPWSSSSWTIIL